MKMKTLCVSFIAVAAAGQLLVGCQSSHQGVTNPQEPGPAAGRAVGAGAGLVVGNVAGAVVGVGEGTVAGVAAPFTPPPTSNVQEYRTVVGPDGTVTRVPVTVTVDQYGRAINSPGTNK